MSQYNSSLTSPAPENSSLFEIVRRRGKKVTYPAKHLFLEPGMILDGIYYICEGRTRHYMVDMEGREKVLYTLTAGWFYGETPCSLKEPTGLYSKTELKTVMYKVSRNDYEELLDSEKVFRDAVLKSYATKMLILRHEIENITFYSCKNRLMRVLCSTADTTRRAEGNWYDLRMNYTQYELSIIVGGARVNVSKLLNEMCAEGTIRMLNRNIQLNADEYERFIRDHVL
ncbi:Crp/Fnr family transcriptional regulator [Lachnospiraceae bacterium 54-53]